MFMNVVKIELKPGSSQPVIGLLKKTAAPLLQKAEGFVNLFAGVEPGTNTIIYVLLWESEEADRNFETNHQTEIQNAYAEAWEYYLTAPSDDNYEILAKI